MTPAKALIPLILVGPLLLGPAPDAIVPPAGHGISGTTVLSGEEECLYEVSWTLIKLGTVRVKTFPDLHAEAYIDSYNGIPFVDLHSVASCVMDSLLYCRESRLLEKRDDQWWGLEYHADVPSKSIQVVEILQKDPASTPTSRSPKESIPLREPQFIDGLSIGIFPRRFVQTREHIMVPTILYGKLGMTAYSFNRDIVGVDIDALERPVRTVDVTGYTDAKGVLGLSGNYEAWFSDDSLGVPIKAKVKVLLGSVTLELKQWHRKGWNPPLM